MAWQILTALRTGGEYKREHVERLQEQCALHAPGVPFRCLSDDDSVPGFIPAKHDWPGWWVKIEMFRLPGPILYMDLDTTICGPLAPLIEAASAHPFLTLRDFYYPRVPREVGSGLMAWTGDMSPLYDEFRRDPAGWQARCRTPQMFGDQGFIEATAPRPAFWQDIASGVYSYKKHCRSKAPADVRVICFHGKPRPWEV